LEDWRRRKWRRILRDPDFCPCKPAGADMMAWLQAAQSNAHRQEHTARNVTLL